MIKDSEMQTEGGSILVVDDNDAVTMFLELWLDHQGHEVDIANNGQVALEKLRGDKVYDLVLLDITMPLMSGIEVLRHIRDDQSLRHIPVIMISALSDRETVLECIRLGATDYIEKPIDNTLLKARVESSLERKKWHDQAQDYLEQLEQARSKSEWLLLNVLPQSIADRLKQGEDMIADKFESATVLFADIINFTMFSADLPPLELVGFLNEIFSTFDQLTEKHGLEKIKTVGDEYMVVGGVPLSNQDHVHCMAEMALDILDAIDGLMQPNGEPIQVRIGMHTGPVVAGIIGRQKFSYDLWGDTVNIASRMESTGKPGKIQVTEDVYKGLNGCYAFEHRGFVPIKGKGEMNTYFLNGRRALVAEER